MNVYTAEELKKENPKAFEKAFQEYRESRESDGAFWSDEVIQSLKGLMTASGLKMTDWAIGGRGTFLSTDISEEAGALEGKRALAWIENNLLGALRIPWTGEKRKSVAKYGDGYRPGQVKSCPFTGVCYDEDFIDALLKEIKEGMNLKDAYASLAEKADEIINAELEAELEESYFLEHASANEYGYTIDGVMV